MGLSIPLIAVLFSNQITSGERGISTNSSIAIKIQGGSVLKRLAENAKIMPSAAISSWNCSANLTDFVSILSLQPRDKAAMLVVNKIGFSSQRREMLLFRNLNTPPPWPP